MGDFDKNSAAGPPSEKKKLVIVGLLGAVLLGVVGFESFKPGPAQASGAAVAGSSTDVPAVVNVPQETAEQAQAALQNDPTATLLRGRQDRAAEFAAVPRNPFAMSDEWRNELVKDVVPAAPAEQQTTTEKVNSAPQAVKIDQFKLTGIFRQDQRLFAIINGNILTVGAIVENARVVDIKLNRVILQNADSPDGPHATLTIDPQLK